MVDNKRTEEESYGRMKMEVGISNIPTQTTEFIEYLLTKNERLHDAIEPQHKREMSIKQMRYRKMLYQDILPAIAAMSIVIPPSLDIAKREISLLVKLQEDLKELGYDSGELQWDDEDPGYMDIEDTY